VRKRQEGSVPGRWLHGLANADSVGDPVPLAIGLTFIITDGVAIAIAVAFAIAFAQPFSEAFTTTDAYIRCC
jgi:hypothetical protein